MKPVRSVPPFDLNSEENREARQLLQERISQAGSSSSTTGSTSSNRTSGTCRPASSFLRTSANSTATAAPTKSFWDGLCGSSSDDEEGRPTPPPASSPRGTIAPPLGAAVAVDIDVAAGNEGEDSDDSEFNKYFPGVKAADLPSSSTCHSTTLASPSVTASTSGGLTEAKEEAKAVSSIGRSLCGNAGKKRRREGKDDAAPADREPPPPRRSDFNSSEGNSDSGGDDKGPLQHALSSRRSNSTGGASGRSRPRWRSSSPRDGGDDRRTRSDLDPDSDFGDSDGGGRASTPTRRSRQTKKGAREGHEGHTDMMQMEVDSDSDFGVGATSAEKQGSGREEVAEEEDEDEHDNNDNDDEEEAEEDEEGLKPTLSHAPFNDTDMKPLVLTNESGGQRAEVPASVNRYLKDYQREGVSAFPVPALLVWSLD